MSLATTSQLAERIRAAVACFRVAEKATGKLYVLLEAAATEFQDPQHHERPGLKRIAARRVYAGEHKNLEGKWTIVIGHDLAEATPTPVSIPVQHRSFEVTVRATPCGGADIPFEGVFDLKSIEIEKPPG
jgi:hypothetical protein